MRQLSIVAVMTAAAALTATIAIGQVSDTPGGFPNYYHGHGMMWGGDQWGGLGLFFGPVFMLLLLAGLIIGVVFLVRGVTGQGPTFGGAAGNNALTILKERFARGEIDAKEFDERRKLLTE